eukprot:5734845-Pyramimonas_sp.AAC.1
MDLLELRARRGRLRVWRRRPSRLHRGDARRRGHQRLVVTAHGDHGLAIRNSRLGVGLWGV